MNAYDESLKLWPVSYTEHFIETSFGLTNVIECGNPELPPLVLLHGASMSSTMWYPNVENYSSEYRVFAVDIMGDKNKSVPAKEFTNRRGHAKWLEEVLDKLNIQKANFVALSYGGLNLINFLVHAPNRANRVVVMSPAETFVHFTPEFYTYAFGMIQNKEGVEKFLNWIFEDRYTVKEQIANQLIAGMMWLDTKRGGKPKKTGFPYVFTDQELSSIKTPLLLLLGEYEVMYDPIQVMERSKIMPNITSKIVEGAGHLMSLEAPEITANLALEFLKER
ncbi:alpha/beta fold hydrolase [Bacillus sp. M6-12]|uniref:alpha/beta fold hydrolase n=1 Tax=Bacillus sp. M6-12 TaxID=2054166 RepID=UPI002154FC3C|nr:alpha/beta hydrolase [Bacillus sp. M6-12]